MHRSLPHYLGQFIRRGNLSAIDFEELQQCAYDVLRRDRLRVNRGNEPNPVALRDIAYQSTGLGERSQVPADTFSRKLPDSILPACDRMQEAFPGLDA